jgi:hypothetical protein
MVTAQNNCRTFAVICLWLYSPLLDFGRFFSFVILYTVSRTPLTGISPSQDRYLHTE